MFTFGLNTFGQLGHSDGEPEVPLPQEVILPEPAIAVAAGNHHTLCVTQGGLVWAWGSNNKGQCGLGNEVDYAPEPRLIASLKNEKIANIAAGAEHSLAVTTTGEVYSWGCGESGRLGHGTPSALQFWGRSKNELKPRLVRALETQKVSQISAGHMHSGCVTEEGRAFLFGSGRFHQIGRTSDVDAGAPIELKGPSSVLEIACGGAHSLAVTAGGVVASWGADQGGCLGRGKVKGGDIKKPEPVPGVLAEHVAAGWKHSAALAPGGKLFTWGWGGSQGMEKKVTS